MNIEGKICNLRALEPEDIDVMYGWENDTDVWRVSGTVAPFSRHILYQLLEQQKFDIYATRQLRLVIESRSLGIAVGAVDLFEFDPQNLRAGVGIIISPEHRHQGYAKDALLTLEHYVREILHLHQLWCSISEDNIASRELFTRTGYSVCGCRHDWILTPDQSLDEILMQKIL